MRCAVAFLSGYRVDQWVRVSCVFTHRDWRAQRAPSADAVTMDLEKGDVPRIENWISNYFPKRF